MLPFNDIDENKTKMKFKAWRQLNRDNKLAMEICDDFSHLLQKLMKGCDFCGKDSLALEEIDRSGLFFCPRCKY